MTTSLADDLLNGPAEIAAFTGFSEHSVRHYIRTGAMPAFRAGSRIMARKSSILNWVAAQEAPALPAGMAAEAVNDNRQRRADAPPYSVGDDIDGDVVQHVESLGPGIHFIGMTEGFAAIQISPEDLARIPEPWRSAFPYVNGWVDWQVKQPRRRKAA